MGAASTMYIGYIVKGFPRATETFIAHEIRRLEALGLRIRVYSIKPGEPALGHSVLREIAADIVALPVTTSLSATSLFRWLAQNWPAFRAAHRALLRAVPRRYFSTLAGALNMSWRHRKAGSRWPRKVYIKEFLQAGAIAADLLSRGDVVHLHGHFCHGATTVTWLVSQLTGHEFSFTAHAKDIYEAELNPRGLLPRKMAAARFIATCTEANRQHLATLLPAHPALHTIYHGLDPSFFTPGAPRASAARPLILSIGRIVEKKGFGYLAEACARLKSQGLVFQCMLVGARDSAYADLTQRLREFGLGDEWFTIAPPMNQQDLCDLYRRATVFVLPCLIADSGDRDGIPNVLAEAMASGLPVVSTAISGIPEIVRHQIDGWLVPEKHTAELATALATLLTDAALRARLGAAARARICQIFDSRETTRALYDLFRTATRAPQALPTP